MKNDAIQNAIEYLRKMQKELEETLNAEQVHYIKCSAYLSKVNSIKSGYLSECGCSVSLDSNIWTDDWAKVTCEGCLEKGGWIRNTGKRPESERVDLILEHIYTKDRVVGFNDTAKSMCWDLDDSDCDLELDILWYRPVENFISKTYQKQANKMLRTITNGDNMRVDVKIVKISPDALIPEYKTIGSSGADIYCSESFSLAAHETKMIHTGLKMEIPPGFEIQIRPRSGMAKKGITVANTPGTIDSDYRGEVCVLLTNTTDTDIGPIEKGTRIAQMVLFPVFQATFVLKEALNKTARGEGGFGSTGDK